jgi:hypothetical protein
MRPHAGAGAQEVFRRHRSQPMEQVISLINPMLRGWVNDYAWGIPANASASSKTGWRRRSGALQRMPRNGRVGGERWNKRWLYDTLGLPECDATGRKSPQHDRSYKPGMKQMGARRAGNPHAASDVAGPGNVAWTNWCDTRRRKGETTGTTNVELNRRASPRPYRRAGSAKADPDPYQGVAFMPTAPIYRSRGAENPAKVAVVRGLTALTLRVWRVWSAQPLGSLSGYMRNKITELLLVIVSWRTAGGG